MGYEYKPTKAERRAATLLRDKGWRVDEPSCPICHGFGIVNDWQPVVSDHTTVLSSTVYMKACPNGCQVSWYYSSSQNLGPNGWPQDWVR